MDYELRTDSNGSIWKHSINKKGRVLECGVRCSAEAADALVSSGEARWQAAPKAAKSAAASVSFGSTYAEDVQRRADAGEQIQPRDWNHAMNRDD